MKRSVVILLVLSMLFSLAACNIKPIPTIPAEPEETPMPVPTPEPTPEPTPTPTPEPELPEGSYVTVNGVDLGRGIISEDALYVKAEALFDALGEEIVRDDGIVYRNEGYLPLEDICADLHISVYNDSEFDRLYCTPGAGDWVLPEGCSVPVLMYHAVSDEIWSSLTELFVSPAKMEEQLAYLVENDFTPIFFEDLKNIENIEKPVILTFDDGYEDNYTNLFPLLQKYNVKATIFLISGWIGGDVYLNEAEIQEMQASGLVSFQSHTASHPDMSTLDAPSQEQQASVSKLQITRLTGKEPFVLCYPSGKYNDATREAVRQYYRFGILMGGASSYATGSDPTLVPRMYVKRTMTVSGFANLVNR